MDSIKREFQRKNFGLKHSPIDDFFKSQWQRKNKSVLWLLYRWAFAIFFSIGVISSCIVQFNHGLWFIYLTHWGFALCMLTSLFGAILTTIYYFDSSRLGMGVTTDVKQCIYSLFAADDSKVTKLYWALHWTTLVLAILISFVFWVFLVPVTDIAVHEVFSYWSHVFNSILMVLDHMLVAFPTRLLHTVYPFSLSLIYSLFTFIYYCAGGVDEFGNAYIYEIMNWSNPIRALVTVLGCGLLEIIFCILLFLLFKLRTAMFNKKNNGMIIINE